MALVVGENSWATVAEADDYLTDRVGTQEWFNLDETPSAAGEPSKETYLIMAYNYLLTKNGYCLDSTLTDENVKKAQIEFAFYFVDNFTEFEDDSNSLTKGAGSFNLSKWREQLNSEANWNGDYPLPAFVSVFLTEYQCTNVTVNLDADD